MPFTEFCCRSGGSNLNAGTRTGNSTVPGTGADFTYASGTWVNATNTFTVASGNPSTDGVAVGDFCSLYVDGSTVTGYVARVTAVGATTVQLSATAKSGTAPADGVSTRTLKVGGAWKGPNAAEAFPLAFVGNAMTNVTGNVPRVNFMNDAAYSITTAITHVVDGTTGRITLQGFTAAYGEGGKAVIDGGTSCASYILVAFTSGSAGGIEVTDTKFQNNGATGSANLVTAATGRIHFYRCVFSNSRGSGVATSGTCIECEAFDCNQSNTSSKGGFDTVPTCVRCVSHDNAGSNSAGFLNCTVMRNCIADTNGGKGILVSSTGDFHIGNCDCYNNGGDGISLASSASTGTRSDVESCNLVKNGGYGINLTGANNIFGEIRNCGFGSGTQANTSGTVATPGAAHPIQEFGSITYAADVTPWVDPGNGDFRINLTAAKGTGRGSFTQTAASYAGTVAYPDIGSAQHQESGSAVYPVSNLTFVNRGRSAVAY